MTNCPLAMIIPVLGYSLKFHRTGIKDKERDKIGIHVSMRY